MKRSKAHKLRQAIVQGADSLPVETAIEVPELYQKWESGEAVTVETIRRYNDILYKVVQAHTTQSDWTPDITPALWKLYTPEGVIAEWKQPAGAHDAYQIGDKVTWEGQTWECTVANNVWEPGVYGWVVI